MPTEPSRPSFHNSSIRLPDTFLPPSVFDVAQLPNPLEFLGYVYCFTTFLAGPAFEYSEYANVMNETAFVNKNDPKNSKKPTSVLAALWRLLQVRHDCNPPASSSFHFFL